MNACPLNLIGAYELRPWMRARYLSHTECTVMFLAADRAVDSCARASVLAAAALSSSAPAGEISSTCTYDRSIISSHVVVQATPSSHAALPLRAQSTGEVPACGAGVADASISTRDNHSADVVPSSVNSLISTTNGPSCTCLSSLLLLLPTASPSPVPIAAPASPAPLRLWLRLRLPATKPAVAVVSANPFEPWTARSPCPATCAPNARWVNGSINAGCTATSTACCNSVSLKYLASRNELYVSD